MKKILLLVLAVLLMTGVAMATNIPTATDPKNYPTVWTEIVYNGSGSDIVSAKCVSWDFDTSDSDAGTIFDDMAPWVKLTSTADDIWTAGVVPLGYNIVNGTVGRIVIKGPAVVWNNGTAATVNTVVSAGSSGQVYDEAANATDEAVLGVCIKASAAGNDIGGNADTFFSLIYVDPTIYENGA
jgi:hypothetical protein